MKRLNRDLNYETKEKYLVTISFETKDFVRNEKNPSIAYE